jgi:hypothetical protein
MQGDSYPAEIPVLRDRIGYFMCTREGREYLIRLPNVAYSPIPDNQQLADMMNFVVFGLGGASAPKGTKPYTAAEVAKLRTQALATESLIAIRAEVVGKMMGRCAVPKSMNDFYDGQEQTARWPMGSAISASTGLTVALNVSARDAKFSAIGEPVFSQCER